MHWIITGVIATIVITAIVVLWLVGGVLWSLAREFFSELMNMR